MLPSVTACASEAGCRSIILPSEQSHCQVAGQTVYFSVTVHCCFSMLSSSPLCSQQHDFCSASLMHFPSLWTWRHRGVSHCERHKTPFEILYEQPELDWTETSPFLEKRIQIAFPTHCKRRLNTICKKITFHVCFCCQDFPKPIWVTLPQLSVTPMSHGGRAYDDNISCPLPPLLVLE